MNVGYGDVLMSIVLNVIPGGHKCTPGWTAKNEFFTVWLLKGPSFILMVHTRVLQVLLEPGQDN